MYDLKNRIVAVRIEKRVPSARRQYDKKWRVHISLDFYTMASPNYIYIDNF